MGSFTKCSGLKQCRKDIFMNKIERDRALWKLYTTGEKLDDVKFELYELALKVRKVFEGNKFYPFYDGEYIYTPVEVDSGSFVKYGKKSYWHKKITDRYVKQETFKETEGIVETGRYPLESFRGNWYKNALLHFNPNINNILKMQDIAIFECYKTVAVRDEDGSFASVFNNNFTYELNKISYDKIKATNSFSDICSSGGIFVHKTYNRACYQYFPERSDNLLKNRVVLKGFAYGKRREQGKIAVEYFVPTSIMAPMDTNI
jgi:hypothetical protein